MDRRVVVTGMGAVSCGGNSVPELWETLVSGRSGIGPTTVCDVSDIPSAIAGEVRGLVLNDVPKKEERRLARFTRFAMAACDEALKMAGIPKRPEDRTEDPFRFGVIVTPGACGVDVYDRNMEQLLSHGPGGVSAFFLPEFISSSGAGNLSRRYGARGPGFGASAACAAGAYSIGEAWWAIRRGDADMMLAGGSDACITRMFLSGFCSLTAVSRKNDEPEKASRPFDADRDGFVIAEGAGVLFLEELEHAKARGAAILAELAGYGATCDAFHPTAPDPSGAGDAEAMRTALRHAGCAPEQVGHIAAHGTGTIVNDRCETRAIRRAFGAAADGIAVNGIKSMIGHAIGAAGGLGAISCIRTLQTGIVPPTINCEHQDPECDLNVTPLKAGFIDTEYALTNSLGFGGHNAALLFRKWQSSFKG